MAFVLLLCGPAGAETLRIGMSGPITTIDPHFYNTSQNNMAAFQVFDTLIQRSPEGQVMPALALSWRALDDTTWEFKLRPGVRRRGLFHTGYQGRTFRDSLGLPRPGNPFFAAGRTGDRVGGS